MTADERLRFAVEFAEEDLDKLTPGRWMVLRERLGAFVTPGAQGSLPEDMGGVCAIASDFDIAEGEIRSLQREVRATLLTLLDLLGEAAPADEPAPTMLSLQMMPIRIDPKSTHVLVLVRGKTRDVFLATLALLLSRQPFDKVKRCPECRRIFYRERKQMYCMKKCLNRANMRAWREAKGKRTVAAKRRKERDKGARRGKTGGEKCEEVTASIREAKHGGSTSTMRGSATW